MLFRSWGPAGHTDSNSSEAANRPRLCPLSTAPGTRQAMSCLACGAQGRTAMPGWAEGAGGACGAGIQSHLGSRSVCPQLHRWGWLLDPTGSSGVYLRCSFASKLFSPGWSPSFKPLMLKTLGEDCSLIFLASIGYWQSLASMVCSCILLVSASFIT